VSGRQLGHIHEVVEDTTLIRGHLVQHIKTSKEKKKKKL
jgi:hypothetical protein